MTESAFEKRFTDSVPIPMCVVGEDGKIIGSNSHISDVFIYDELVGRDFFQLTGIRLTELMKAMEEGRNLVLERNDKTFQLITSMSGNEKDAGTIYVFFYDITSYESLKDTYNDEKTCVCIVRIDNYDELIASTLPDMRMTVSTEVDKTIRHWAAAIDASIINNKSNEYVVYFQHARLKDMIDSKFAILDEVRQIETEADFPMSLSIGIGVGGDTLLDTEEMASAALELALGRGGDQAVVRSENQTDYYGGTLQTVEKGNKGKSRVVAHVLNQLITEADRILIMGHANPDMDCFGASLGMFRVCKMIGREPTIVLTEVNDPLQAVYRQAKETARYVFVGKERALELANEGTLLIIVDTHRQGYLDCPELLDKVGKVAIIDHHRRASDSIKNADLQYIESYASSACELVSEILQYSGKKRALEKLEAEALLGGISIDTNRFAVKTGVRTFEAAAWLRRSGADTTEVKRFFQTDIESFRLRAKGIADAEVKENGIATSICRGRNRDAQVINSQVADELLNIKGVRASFVAGVNESGKTVVSARSLGDVNVQVIMEQLGGGGHLTTAGAQVEMSPEEALDKIQEILKERQE